MPNYLRYTKAPKIWTSYDLGRFNIEVVFDEDPLSFFGVSELPAPQDISPVIWNYNVAPAGPLSKEEKTFFALLQDVMRSSPADYAAPIDFFLFLLGYLGYDDDASRVLHTRRKMSLLMFGEWVDATSDVCLLEEIGLHKQYLLLVQQDKSYINETIEPYAPLVAKAIAAFHYNNGNREYPWVRLKSQMFPGITVVGTSVVFYKITVTQALAEAVMDGVFPEERTTVYEFRPRLNMAYSSEGMVAVENRRFLLMCLEAFKQFIVAPDREELKPQSLN